MRLNPSGLCWCGCGDPAPIATYDRPAWGWVKGEPKRYICGHNRRKTPIRYIKQDCGYETRCWVWQFSRYPNGYGRTYEAGEEFLAHRAYYERRFGPIPEGLDIDHLCRNRACVNPNHLEPVTHRENVLRGNGPAAINARKTHCIHGHEYTLENTKIGTEGWRKCRTCELQQRKERYQRDKAARLAA